MNRLQQQIKKIATEDRVGIMTHVIVGYPSMQETEDIVCAMAENGADFVELQIPFSDPVADGPTILKASQKSLDSGTTVEDAFTLAKKLRKRGVTIPLLFMTYANVALSYGIEKFVQESKNVEIDGFIIPDIPFDTKEGENMSQLSQENDMCLTPLYAPTMNPERYTLLSKYSNTLLYAVSRTGVTGVEGVSTDLDTYIKKIRDTSSGAIALGFGIQSTEQIHALKGLVDIAVVGSHLLRKYDEEGISGITTFLQSV